MKRKNIIAGLVLIFISVGYAYLTTGLPIRTLPDTPNPAFFPWINTGIMLILSVSLLTQGLFYTEAGEQKVDKAATRLTVISLSFFVIYLLILPSLGFVVASIPFFAAMMLLFEERRPIVVAISSVAVIVLLFCIFRYGFGVFLPLGVTEGLVP
jgi:putative tricarboxylic transport membrane protein